MTSAAEPAQPRPAAPRPGGPPAPPDGPPTASYRLQLQPGFTLRDATAAVPYLAALGVSHLHLSPLLEAVPGSTHGYDTVDHTRISEQLGGEPALRALAAAAHAHGLRLIADVVPNHMAVPVPERLNRPLWQVLRDGPDSPYARWFDIDWTAQPGPADAPGRGRVLLPLLGDRLGAVLDQLTVDGAVLRYHRHELPLRPGTEHLPLPELLGRQWYRLAWWRLARTELNYRRFFTVNELIALRVEDPVVFAATHAVLLGLHTDGVLDGFRIDHPDGLADPRGYLRRLAAATGGASGTTGGASVTAPGAYIVVEKILTGEERLPEDWPVAGTTGYDALRRIDGLLTDGAGARRLAGAYESFLRGGPVREPTEEPDRDLSADPHPAVAEARRGRADMTGPHGELAAEVERLVRTALRIGAAEPAHADHAPWQLRAALGRLLTGYPAYRPYARPGEAPPAVSREQLRAALDGSTDPTDRLVAALALGELGRGPDHDEFCVRFAQTAAAVAAKGVEDTAFYRWNALPGLNEVGGEPSRPGLSPAEFHDWCRRQERDWPHGMTVLSTHDTKRSADARARLAVLAEQPEAWAAEATAWSAAAGPAAPGLDRDADWLLWHTLVAAWPITPDRLVAALLKAVREAKLHTSWTEPDPPYERALEARARAVHDDAGLLARIEGTVRALAPYARANTLAAALLHLTVPGVPDLYQGSEEPLYTLVDPDNRGLVDLGALAVRLTDSATPRPGDLAREKLHLTAAALHLRRARPLGPYRPLTAVGPAADHLTAFARGEDVVTAVTRLPYGLERAGGWRGTALELPAGGPWTDELTLRDFPAGPVPVAELLATLPVALLTRRG
ncbi:malto-oligosyltrehalose synthase [Kitasatospora xanthocidica]|uniref:malto-oligosyltrehalose synthase n=1 Tax=Kitasatospora xanthocidica TaxID=83382 RepID=UPI001677AEE0|nr:malto-oligosyltrehalose synthase [Kitasatospora xanthocidica]GHF40996.1 malto-oligosyltrehalose synthase [Kitasatospora xanthocidica]